MTVTRKRPPMTLTTTGTATTSGQTSRTPLQTPCSQRGWEVSWRPGRLLDRNTATTTMIPAGATAGPDLHEGHRLWPHIQSRAARPGLTAPGAVTRAALLPGSPRRQHGRDGERPDPGAGQ